MLWHRLQIIGLVGGEEPFPFADGEIAEVDWAFVKEELNYLAGNVNPPTKAEAVGSTELGEELRDIIKTNHARLVAIQTGVFFEIKSSR